MTILHRYCILVCNNFNNLMENIPLFLINIHTNRSFVFLSRFLRFLASEFAQKVMVVYLFI